MKKLLVALVALLIAASPAFAEEAKELNVFSWSEYIPQEVVNGFTKETGIKVVLSTYESNEAMYAKLKGSGESQAAYAEKLEDDDAVMKAVSCAHMAESFKFDLMGAVVALIVALAGGLALVVLFTLANTNVSEREREMATLKVLGFFDKEVHHYVNREMMVLLYG